jgi:hypothetical protein
MNVLSVAGAATLVFALFTSPANAEVHFGGSLCSVDSDYDMKVESQRLVFTASDQRSVITLMPGGAVQVDGKALDLDANDRRLFAGIEHGLRELVPEAKALALDAIGIAFEAVGHASTAFAATPQQARASAERIARTARDLTDAISAKESWNARTDTDFEHLIEGTIGTLVGEVIGNVAAQAIKVAFSGDEAAVAELEARASSIEKTVDKAVNRRGKELEARADDICRRVRDLDALESRIGARMPDGSKFDLVRVKP